MKGIIRSYTGLTIAVIASFFVFALQGLSTQAFALGIFSILMISIKQFIMLPSVKSTTFYNPSRSRRVKNKRLRVA